MKLFFRKSRYSSRYLAVTILLGGIFNIFILGILLHWYGPGITVYLSSDDHYTNRRARQLVGSAPTDPDPTLPPISVEHISRPYDGNSKTKPISKSQIPVAFNVSNIFNPSNYTQSLSNHHVALYSDQLSDASNQLLSFHNLKPQCVRQHSTVDVCYLSNCHDTSPQSHFDEQMSSLNRPYLAIPPYSESQKWSPGSHHLKPQSFADRGSVNENTAPLPRSWLQYGIDLNTVDAFSYLLYRPDGIRSLLAAKSTACFISHRHRFVFIHVLKSGGTSMVGFLTYALCNSTDIKDCDQSVFMKRSCKKHKGRNGDYFHFAIVRNPYDRMFSLWSHQFTMGLEKRRNGGFSNSKLSKMEKRYGKIEEKWGKIEDKMKKPRNMKLELFHEKMDQLMPEKPDFELMMEQHEEIMNRANEAMHHEKPVKPPPDNEFEQRTGRRLNKYIDGKLYVEEYSREELLQNFAEFVWEKRFVGKGKGKKKKTGMSSDHIYCQSWWLFNKATNCPIVDFIGHLETINFDIQYIMNLIPHNRVIMEYYVANGEYWHTNTFGSTLKRILYTCNDSETENVLDDGMTINGLGDIYKNAAKVSGINVQRFASELYDADFRLFGYDKNKIDDNRQLDFV